MERTSIFADEELLRKLRAIAKRENTTGSELIRKAMEHYVSRGLKRSRLSLTGVGRSGRHDVAERVEELLGKGFGH